MRDKNMNWEKWRQLPAFLKEMVLLRVFRKDDYKRLSGRQFDYIAEQYDREGVYERVKEDYPQILAELRKESFGTLLDCGCGTGAILSLLREEYPEADLAGIDLSGGMIRIAEKRKLSGVRFIVGDCEQLPFPDDSFDVLLCSHSFHHYPHPETFFENAARVLRPGGRLILRDNTGDLRYLLRQNLYAIPRNNFKYHDGDVRFYSIRQVRRFCEKAGLMVLHMEEQTGNKLHGAARKPEAGQGGKA